MNMNIKLLMNDFRKQAWKNTVLFVFMSLTVTLAASVVLMLSQLFLTINTMYETAKPAHFLQMHMGTVNQDDIDEFNEGFEGITHWQTVPMVTLYGDNIIVSTQDSTYSLADCRFDISFVRQNDGYDVLLDEKREPLSVKDGEIGVPIIMLDQFDISLGDTIYLRGNGVDKAFKVVTFVYDGSMNSTTCSSTRFLISDGDFDSIFGRIGETEYLIEAYFTDKSLASSYQTLYEQYDKNLPKNGQAISYTVIYLLSALTDILTAVVFVLAGVLMIVVVVICLRYVILAELEDDVVEIGTMKSIGIPEKSIENLYLSKIRILMVLACVTGFAFALLFLPKFTSHITRFFGEQPLEPVSVFLAVFMVVLLFFLILLFARKILKKIRTKSIVDLMVLNDGFGKRTRVTSGLYRRNKLSTNAAVGLFEIRNGYGIVFVLMAVITFLVMVPMRFLHTMQADEMVTYMGSPECDLLVEVMQGDALEERNSVLLKALAEKKENIESLDVQKRIRIQVLNADDEPVGVHVDTGFQAGKGIEYLKGTYPVRENEIALSYLLAEELGKKLGDTVSVSTVSKDYLFEVCGIYQDVTSGGKTAKTEYDFPEEKAEKYIYQLNLLDRQSVADFSGILKNNLGTGYSVKSMDSFLDQILGGITARLSEAVCLIINIGIVLTIFLVLLFMELRVARTMHSLAEKKGIGIPFRAILLQELYPMLLLGAGGVIVGILLSELIGEVIVSTLFSLLGLGITSIPFLGMSVDCVLLPVGLVVLLGVINTGVCQKIRKVDITRYFNQ